MLHLGSRISELGRRISDPQISDLEPLPNWNLQSEASDLGRFISDLESRIWVWAFCPYLNSRTSMDFDNRRPRVLGLGSRVSDLGSRVSDLGSRTLDVGTRILDLGSQTLDLSSQYQHRRPAPSMSFLNDYVKNTFPLT